MPAMAKNSRARARLPAEKLRFRNRAMSSIGSSRRFSQPTNTTPIAMPTAKLTSDDVEVQPRSGAWMMAYTSELIEAIDRTAPIGSSRVA